MSSVDLEESYHDPRTTSAKNDPSFIAETSFVRAPLNSRVPSVSLPPKDKGKAKQETLERVPLEIQEALLLEDLLYVFMVCTPNIFWPWDDVHCFRN